MPKHKGVPFFVNIDGFLAKIVATSMTKKAHEKKKRKYRKKGYLVRTVRGGKNEPYNLFARKK